ncbi:probable tRNA (uracil-O(2)-)-methyltransferase isoform X2 [Bombyx mori]|uniref:tRNA (uracil-O(2)-)-methyltransferase n=1 Tax=Bombyx mori TaxID=7091 RepID=A0A8R2LXW7_BOMMO|nr:probable tRNA (uracil-O(2)-)-methyltransferase isoform X2 [Bombyx mori]
MTATTKFSCSPSKESFYEAVQILITKPHVVNKRLWGSKIWLKHNCISLEETVTWPNHIHKLESVSTPEIEKYIDCMYNTMKLQKCDGDSISDCFEINILELFPKNYADKASYQLIIINKLESYIIFYNVTPSEVIQNTTPSFTYGIHVENDMIVLNAHCDDENSKSYMWLKNKLLPQFIKWTTETESNNGKKKICTASLTLVSSSKYFEKYNELKLKYGKDLVKIWPECTDPTKFVYEDVAIATYLLLLWEDRSLVKKQTFVDLGCGNGLLVYILCKEGHAGLGIDVRKREIWDMYPPEMKTIVPSESNLFPNADWIIGNHSDELTPWIPVIAAKSSYKCNFFLLPCCAFNFDGSKYQRVDSKKSQYTEYLEHVKKICEDCGFITDLDRLKIPSTKRICLVSNGRMYSPDTYKDSINKISKIFKEKHARGNVENDTWLADFKARESTQKVRNCTQLDKNLIESIVKIVTDCLLEGCSKDCNEQWSVGKIVEISELVSLIPKQNLIKLKSECGGLQTLLKNNHNIFLVSGGKVQLRYPKTVDQVITIQKRQKIIDTKIQVKPCWFHNNHPQGCPLSSINCSFLHSKG